MHFVRYHWSRPIRGEYPKIWHRFSRLNKLGKVETFSIQDLPPWRSEDAITFMVENLFPYEPIGKAYNVYNNKIIIEEVKSAWRDIVKQRAVLVCFDEGSGEIVGVNMNYVRSKIDFRRANFLDHGIWKVFHFLSHSIGCLQSSLNVKIFNVTVFLFCCILDSLGTDYDFFKQFGVSEYLTAAGLTVSPKYRRRGIATQLLKAREKFCNEFQIELTLNRFTSDYSNKAADKAGFKLAKIRSYDDIRKEYPHLPHVESEALTLKFMKFPYCSSPQTMYTPNEK